MLWGDTLRIARILQYGQETLAKNGKYTRDEIIYLTGLILRSEVEGT
jgi:hypothetical protein